MDNSFINTLPLLIANEKPVLMDSIVTMLRRKGFVVIRITATTEAIESPESVMTLDGLNMLRYITEHWPKEIPVLMLENNLQKPIRSLLAA